MKRIAARFWLLAIVSMAACEEGSAIETGKPMLGGQTGAGGMPRYMCRQTSDCERQRMEEVARLREPEPVSKLASAACVALDDESIEIWQWKEPGACRCLFPCESEDGHPISGFQCNAAPFAEVYFGINFRGSRFEWCWPGDRLGRCLIGPDEARGCTPGRDSCQAECELLEQRWHAERTKAHAVELRAVECVDPCGSAQCQAIVRIDDECFFDHASAEAGGYDCSMTDAEILRAAGVTDHVQDDAGVCGPRAQAGDDAGAP